MFENITIKLNQHTIEDAGNYAHYRNYIDFLCNIPIAYKQGPLKHALPFSQDAADYYDETDVTVNTGMHVLCTFQIRIVTKCVLRTIHVLWRAGRETKG